MTQDIHIRNDVQHELFYTPILNSARIGVAVEDGVATLSGSVETYEQKLAALRAAERVTGVRAVACQLQVRLPGPHVLTDTGLAQAAANVLAWDSAVPPDRVRVRVENGWITLEGTLDWQYQKEAAANAVAGLTGAKGVDNLINVNPSLNSEGVKQQIESALRQSPTIEDRNILVEVNHDKVVLHGEVHSIAEREEAEKTAWAAMGVADVANHIVVAEAISTSR